MRRLSLAFGVGMLLSTLAHAQLSDQELAKFQARAKAEGWTFTVGRTPASERPLDELCGLVVPEDWQKGAPMTIFPEKDDLPAAFNWRTELGCPPIRNQGGCGACWAFATVGPLECNILLKDGMVVDLSEQWLVSCNQETTRPILPSTDPLYSWGCNGGWFAHDYHLGAKTDPCGGGGAVLESDFPYVHAEVPCNCPYPHPYTIESWAFIGPERNVADTNAIKQAILQYGPVTAGMYADYTFSAYTGGVFNQGALQPPNHGVVLVGWDDRLGAEGVWLLRNGWGSYWGENGYMWIEYGRSYVGYGACYVDYAGQGLLPGPTITRQPSGGQVQEDGAYLLSIEADGIGPMHYAWEHDGVAVGTDAPEFLIANASAADRGLYRCTVSDFRGTTTSAATEILLAPGAETPAAPSGALWLLTILVAFSACLLLRRRSA